MTRSNCNLPAPILEYIEMIEQGKVLACAEQHKLVALVRKAFETEDLCFIQEQFDEYMGYQKYFPFDLFPWETFCFALHNCTYDAEGDPEAASPGGLDSRYTLHYWNQGIHFGIFQDRVQYILVTSNLLEPSDLPL